LGNLNYSRDRNRAWEIIEVSKKMSAKESLGLHELKQHKPWCDEECLGFSDLRKQTKMHWLQDQNQSSLGNLNNVTCKDSKHFRNKKEISESYNLLTLN
jgi:hypothetical protein